jgi:DNA-binding NtrC family response regulator
VPGTTTASGGEPMGTDAAIEVLLKAATSDPDVQLLPWLEREFTLHAMKVTKGNQVRAAKLLGVTRATLRKRIERFGITKELMIT